MPDRLASRIVFAVLDMVQESGHWKIPGDDKEILEEIKRLTDTAIIAVEQLLKEEEA